MKTAKICFGLLALTLWLNTGCVHTSPDQPYPENFHQVNQEIYRSAQPSANNMAWLANMAGIKSILNLREYHSDKEAIGNLPVELYEIPLDSGSLTEDDIRKILQTVKKAPKPILIHCWQGSDRTGAAVAACRIVFEGWSAEEAIAELKRSEFGHHELLYLNIPRLIREIDWDKMKETLSAY